MSIRLTRSVLMLIALLFIVPAPGTQSRAAPPTETDPLAPFERLIGGQWHLEGSYQVFEWGAGRQSVRGRSYFLVDGKPRLVSEGFWYWHPGEKRIRGVFTAVGMPIAVFEYVTRFDGDRMISDLRAFTAQGDVVVYEEHWDFVSASRFEWSLLKPSDDGLRKEMGGSYTRMETQGQQPTE